MEKTRNELIVDDYEGEELISIKGVISHENDEIFSRSVVATSPSSLKFMNTFLLKVSPT